MKKILWDKMKEKEKVQNILSRTKITTKMR